MSSHPLPRSFYTQGNVVQIAKDLIWKVLYTNIDGIITSWIITETEAYRWEWDRACHGRICTPRTQVMFWEWWHAYIYLCYGLHVLFNIVTNTAGKSDAILIRALEPLQWVEQMLQRQRTKMVSATMTTWPWKVSKALGINLSHYWIDLCWDTIRMEEWPKIISPDQLIIWPRIWVDYAWEDAILPWRFRLKK